MVAENRPLATRVALWLLCAAALAVPLLLIAILWPETSHGQTGISIPESLSADMRTRLERRGDLMLRDATIIEAMFAIEEQWGVNIVVSNDAKEAVNGAFKNAPLRDILDTLLSSQGYGYRVVGESLVVLKADQLGAKKPLFETVRIPLQNIPPSEVVDLIAFLLSPDGKAHAVPSARSVVVMDFPDRIEQVRLRLLELDDAAAMASQQEERDAQSAAEEAAQREAQQRAASQVLNSATIGANNDPTSSDEHDDAPQPDPISQDPQPPASTSSDPDAESSNVNPDQTSNTGPLPPANSRDPAAPVSNQPPQGPVPRIGATDAEELSPPATEIGAVDAADDVPDLEVAIFEPQYVEASTIVESLATMVSEFGTVTAISEENRIVATDQHEYLRRMELAVKQLDRLRDQVRITAIIFDASLEDLEDIGVNLTHTARGRNLDVNGVAQDSITLGTLLSPAPAPGAINGTLTAMSLSENVDITGIVRLLRTSNKSQLLADPTVVVMNRESARIEIVTEIPYQQLTESAQGGSIGTTAFREAGVTLEVTPRIAADGLVNLVVTPQFSVLTGFTDEDNQPIIDRRAAQTVVTVADQQTLVIGGLRQRSKVRNRAAIPVISNAPLIGRLFRQRSDEIRESELVVFLTPTIITPQHFGTCREQRTLEYSKCELEKVDEYQCYRCNPPEDPAIYTNPDFCYMPVHVHEEVLTPDVDVDDANNVSGSGNSQTDNQPLRLPASRRRADSNTPAVDQGLPPVTAPTLNAVPTPTTSTRRNQPGQSVQNQPIVAPALPVQQAQRASINPARTARAQDSANKQQPVVRQPQRVAQNNEIRRFTHLPPVASVPPPGRVSVPGAAAAERPNNRHAAPGGFAKPIGRINVIRGNAAPESPHSEKQADDRHRAPGGMTRPIVKPKVIRGNQDLEVPASEPNEQPQQMDRFFNL